MLYIIYQICSHEGIKEGNVKLYCVNKGAITKSFHPEKPGIGPFLSTDHELLHAIQTILKLMPISIIGEWVKGHYTGKDQKIQHNLKVCLLYQKSVITSRLYSVLSKELHDNLLQKYVLKKTKWEVATFNKVDWDAHESAFNRLPRCLTITTAKLIHNLANTNRQKILYYKSCALCPGCQAEEETFEHILKCSFPSTAKF